MNQLLRDRPKIDIKAQIVDETRAKLLLRILNENDFSILVRQVSVYPKRFEMGVIAQGGDMRSHHFSALAALEGRTARRVRAKSDEIFMVWRKLKGAAKAEMPRRIKCPLFIKISWTPGNGIIPVFPLLKIIYIGEYHDLIRAATMEPDENVSSSRAALEPPPW